MAVVRRVEYQLYLSDNTEQESSEDLRCTSNSGPTLFQNSDNTRYAPGDAPHSGLTFPVKRTGYTPICLI